MRRWEWFALVICLGIINGGLSEEHQQLKPSSTVVVGTVYCDTCFNDDSSKSSSTQHSISGASIAVECRSGKAKPSFRQEAKTDEKGRFKVNLPFSVSKHVKNIKRCSVRLLSSSQPHCSVVSSGTSSSLRRVKSKNQETRVFSAGFFSFKPENQPEICSRNSKSSLPDDPAVPSIPDPSPIPLIPSLPLPPLPLLPPLPPTSAFSQDKEKSSLGDKKSLLHPDFFFPPIPFLPPPSLIPPNPLLPPSTGLPPLPVQPPSAPSLPPLPPIPTIPPVPGLIPPSLPIPLPPVFPGLPPTLPSSSSPLKP